MAKYEMVLDAVQAVQAKMLQNKEAMLGELTSLTSQINQMVGTTWTAPSATEFQQTYDSLRNQITQQLDALEQLAQALQNEIAQWDETARTLG